MREIKFRAWDEGRKEWHIGVAIDEFGDQYTWQKVENDIHAYRKLSSNFLTILQFTGLLDKNGKEIYEGDILHHYYKPIFGNKVLDDIYEVVFEDGQFTQLLINKEDLMYRKDVAIWHPFSQLEVIGNIWENGDLLK